MCVSYVCVYVTFLGGSVVFMYVRACIHTVRTYVCMCVYVCMYVCMYGKYEITKSYSIHPDAT